MSTTTAAPITPHSAPASTMSPNATPAATFTAPDIDNEPPARLTHATKNPNLDVRPAGPKTAKKKPDAVTKANQKATAKNNKIKHEALIDSLDTARNSYEDQLRRIAIGHETSYDRVSRLLNTSSHLQPMREPSAFNAVVHWKTEQVNHGLFLFLSMLHIILTVSSSGRAPGDRFTLAEIQRMVKDDDDMIKFSETELTMLKNELIMARKLVQSGARASHKAEALDMRQTLQKLQTVVSLTIFL